MSKLMRNLVLPAVVILGLLTIIAWMAGAFKEKIEPGAQTVATVKPDDIYTLHTELKQIYESVPATVKAKQATLISSRLLARIEQVHVRAGDEVSQGDLLIELEDRDLETKVLQATTHIDAIAARLAEAKKGYTRAKELNQAGMIATADLDKAKASYDTLNAEHLTAQQQLQEAKTALNFAKVLAPIDGRVVDRFAEPGDTTQPGVPLISLYNPATLRVEAHVREHLALSLELQQKLSVTLPSLDKELPALIEELVPAGIASSRSFLVKVSIPITENLLPGMYARISIPVSEKQLLLIPSERVAAFGQLDVAWVLDSSNRVERRFIRIGDRFNDGMLEVLSGLTANERVLMPPLNRPN